MKTMLQMQHEMNLLIDPNWVKNKNPFMLAADYAAKAHTSELVVYDDLIEIADKMARGINE